MYKAILYISIAVFIMKCYGDVHGNLLTNAYALHSKIILLYLLVWIYHFITMNKWLTSARTKRLNAA